MELAVIHTAQGKCPICSAEITFAGGRGYCRDCFVTFPEQKRSRKELCDEFLVKYYVSIRTGVYHREGCKYLRNVLEENLSVTTEPYGKACACIKI